MANRFRNLGSTDESYHRMPTAVAAETGPAWPRIRVDNLLFSIKVADFLGHAGPECGARVQPARPFRFSFQRQRILKGISGFAPERSCRFGQQGGGGSRQHPPIPCWHDERALLD